MTTVDEIACPACGETEDLSGRPVADGADEPSAEGASSPSSTTIRIQCGRCETVWDRDTSKRCPRCDSTDLYAAPVAVIEKARGTQLSIVSTRSHHLCWSCDRDLIDAQRQSGTALMPDELPTLDEHSGR